ncbi:hypothetical protein YB2330_003417 [Saitoella coloradoensis]
MIDASRNVNYSIAYDRPPYTRLRTDELPGNYRILLNGAKQAHNVTACFSDVFVDYDATFRKQTLSWKELWTNETWMASSQIGPVEVPAHGVKVYKMTPVPTSNMKREL